MSCSSPSPATASASNSSAVSALELSVLCTELILCLPVSTTASADNATVAAESVADNAAADNAVASALNPRPANPLMSRVDGEPLPLLDKEAPLPGLLPA